MATKKAAKKTVRSAKKTVKGKAEEKPKTRKKRENTRPGKNGGRLNTGPGPGRPKDSPEVRALKAFVRSAKAEHQSVLSEMIDSGEYRDLMLRVIREQSRSGKIEALKFLYESVEGKPTLPVESKGGLLAHQPNLTPEQLQAVLTNSIAGETE